MILRRGVSFSCNVQFLCSQHIPKQQTSHVLILFENHYSISKCRNITCGRLLMMDKLRTNMISVPKLKFYVYVYTTLQLSWLQNPFAQIALLASINNYLNWHVINTHICCCNVSSHMWPCIWKFEVRVCTLYCIV